MSFPFHFNASEKLGITSSSTAVERANSQAAREFTNFRMSLSDLMFKVSMCVRSWKKVLNIPADRRSANNALVSLAEEEQEDVDNYFDEEFEEVLEEGFVAA